MIETNAAGLDTSDLPSTSIVLPARPGALRLDTRKTALIIVDMQNAYASPGGYIDIAGFDISGAPSAIEKIALAAEAARRAGISGDFPAERLGQGLCRGGKSRIAELA